MSRLYQKQSLLPPLWILTLLSFFLVGWLAIQLKEILVLLVVGYAIAYVIHPALSWLETRGIQRPIGVILILVALVVAIVILALTAMPVIWREYQNLISNLPDYLSEAKQRVLPYLGKLRDYIPASVLSGNLSESEFKEIASFGPNIANKVFSGIASVALQGYSITLAITNLFLLPFIVFYLAVDFKRLHLALLQLFPVIKRAKVKSLFLEMDQYLAAFVRGQLLVCFILSILYAIGLGLVGVELWFLLGVVSGFGNIVPYLGFLIGIVLSTIMALVTFADLSHVLAVWAVFAVVQTLEGTFITPKVVGDKVGLSPLVVILAVIAGGTLFGLLGIFLAVPGAAVLKVLFSHLSGWIVER